MITLVEDEIYVSLKNIPIYVDIFGKREHLCLNIFHTFTLVLQPLLHNVPSTFDEFSGLRSYQILLLKNYIHVQLQL